MNHLTNAQIIELAPSTNAIMPTSKSSNKYSFVSTIDVLNILKKDGWIPTMASEAKTLKKENEGYQKHLIRFTKLNIIKKDYRMEMLFYNSHNRTCSCTLIGGVFRYVCANGLIMGNKMLEYNYPHIFFRADAIIYLANKVYQYLISQIEIIDQWKNFKLSHKNIDYFCNYALSLIGLDKLASSNLDNNILRTKFKEDRNKQDLWTILNIIQNNIIQGGIKWRNKKGNIMTKRPIQSIHKDKKINQQLWNFAEKIFVLNAA